MNTSIAAIALLLISFATLPSIANADLVSHTVSIPSIDVPGSVEVFLPLFDPSQGTLLDVSFDLVGGGEVSYEVLQDFDDDGGAVFGFMFGEFTVLLGPGSIGNTLELMGDGFYDTTGFFSLQVSGGTGDFSNDPDTVSLFVAQMADELFGTEVLFDGVDVFADDGDELLPDNGVFDSGELTVFYNFTPVPEPNSLLILGLLSLGLAQSRRRKS